MAVIFLDGFENYGPVTTSGAALTAAMQARWPLGLAYYGGNSYASIVAGRNGGKALSIDKTESSYDWTHFGLAFSETAYIILGYAFNYYPANFNTSGGASWNRSHLYFGCSGTSLLSINCGAEGWARFYRGSTVLGAHPVLTGGWHYYEYKIYFHDTLGTIEVRVDGNIVTTLTGLDTRDVSLLCNCLFIAPTANYLFDDMYIAIGETQDYLGPITIEATRPTADVTTDWSTTGSNHFGEIDDTIFDANTYISSNTANAEDQWTCSNLATVTDNIVAVQPSVISILPTAGVRALTVTCESGANSAEATTQIASTSGLEAKLISETDPNTSSAWTKTAVEAANYGVKVGD